MKFLIVVILTVQTIDFNSCETDCILELKPENLEKQPMYFLKKNGDYNIAKPVLSSKGEVNLVIEKSEHLIVSCHISNALTQTNRVEENFTATCKNDELQITSKWLNFFQKEINLENYQCPQKVLFQTKFTGKKCAGKLSKEIEIGFDVLFRHSKKIHGVSVNFLKQKWLDEVKWKPLYSICFNNSVKEVIYTQHTINGASISARQTGISKSPAFVFGSEFRIRRREKINPEKVFVLSDMERGMIADASFIPYFNYEKKNFMPRTLVPPTDMLYFNWKPASYFYSNVAPMWKNLDCTWKNLEKHIRIAASVYETDLIVYTGVYEKYSINNQPVTLDKQRRAITVPYYFWKIVYHKIKRSGIAFVMNNDPFEPEVRLCQSEDKNVGNTWPVYNDVYRLGLLYPCLIEDLRKALKPSYELPKFKITQQLLYPNH